MKTLASAQQFVERLVLAQLEQNVHIFGILEEVLEADDVVVVQTAVNFNFTHQLLLGARLSQRGLRDNFGSRHSFVLQVREFITFGETSLSKELSFQVLLNADVSIELDDLLFDDGLGTVDGAVFACGGTRWFLTHCMFLV